MVGKRSRKSSSPSLTGNRGFLNRLPPSTPRSGTSTVGLSSNNLDPTIHSRVMALEMSLASILPLLSQLFTLISPASITHDKSSASIVHDKSPSLFLDSNSGDTTDSNDPEKGRVPKTARRVKEQAGEQTPVSRALQFPVNVGGGLETMRDYQSCEKAHYGKASGGMLRKCADIIRSEDKTCVEKVDKAKKAERVEKPRETYQG
ncbi:uncharacterized protein LOC116207198 [Punica granatum]|uniref:Uncharacterized protein n=2 Tax=Punica granatum TaxID=22663 RepID=A0A218XLE2_PUNGR|nr:uncharacterized protein LOC116207198 [Punica granatum]OWM85714.1 hypothetical protein CDL15_Pgr029137 [Punica granatum]PKI71223.1 hypothetical protein CRG98_008398 [Punica granatum]